MFRGKILVCVLVVLVTITSVAFGWVSQTCQETIDNNWDAKIWVENLVVRSAGSRAAGLSWRTAPWDRSEPMWTAPAGVFFDHRRTTGDFSRVCH